MMLSILLMLIPFAVHVTTGVHPTWIPRPRSGYEPLPSALDDHGWMQEIFFVHFCWPDGILRDCSTTIDRHRCGTPSLCLSPPARWRDNAGMQDNLSIRSVNECNLLSLPCCRYLYAYKFPGRGSRR